jgi:hypothetical protein
LSTLIPLGFFYSFEGCFQRWKPRKTGKKVKRVGPLFDLGERVGKLGKVKKIRKGEIFGKPTEHLQFFY